MFIAPALVTLGCAVYIGSLLVDETLRDLSKRPVNYSHLCFDVLVAGAVVCAMVTGIHSVVAALFR